MTPIAVTRFVELSHAIRDGMKAYPGLPAARIEAILDHAASRAHYQGQAAFYLGRVEMPGNIGTYIDSPFHRYPDRADLSQLPLDAVAGLPGVVLDATVGADRAITVDCADAMLAGRAVLIRTGWDRYWGDDAYWRPGPFLSNDLVTRLIEAGARLVGVDCWNVDDTDDPARPAHTRLLGAGIPIVEHLCNLGAPPASGFRFSAVPLKLVGGASFPVRAYAEIDDLAAPEGLPFAVAGLDHVVLRVADLARAIAFYGAVLGCREERRIDSLGLVQLRAGRTLIDLIDAADAPPPSPGNMDHVALSVTPFDEAAIRAHLAAHGVTAGETARRYGAEGFGPSIYIADPDGNSVELKGPVDE